MSKAVFSLEPALELELEISETRFGLLPEDLFRLAVRQNTQRAFLFVSKVLGKHLPVEPAAFLAAGKLLALAWLDQKDEQGWAGWVRACEWASSKVSGEAPARSTRVVLM